MFTQIFYFLMGIDAFFWGYLGFTLIIFLGGFLTFKTGFFQIRAFPYVLRTFIEEMFQRTSNERGLHPIKAFFASVGGLLQ